MYIEMARVSIKRYNELVKRLKAEGYTAKTQQAVTSTIYSRVVIPPELKRGGEIRTYKESIEYLHKNFPKYDTRRYTHEVYVRELKGLYDSLRGERTYNAYMNTRRRQYRRSIEIAFNKKVNIKGYTTDQLRDLLNVAWSQAREDPDGSSSFGDHLKQILYQ